MAIVAGDFTASQLRESVDIADSMWANDMMQADFIGNVDTWNAIRAEQNARVQLLEDSEKDREVKIHWINNCANVVEDCDTDDCDLAGARAGSDFKRYGITECKKYHFTVNEMEFRKNDYNMAQAVAVNMLRADKALSEHITQVGIGKIESFKGVNETTTGVGTYNAGTQNTDIAAADWTSRIFAYFYRLGIQNHMPNPFLLSGENLFDDNFLSVLNRENAEGKGEAALFRSMRKYFDLFNIDAVNNPEFKTYMIQRGSVAFASKVYYGAVPTTYLGAGQQRWSIPSRNLAGVRYDVYYTNRCDPSNNSILHDFMLKAHFDYFLNPTGCVDGRTGVLAFNKV